MISNLSRNHKLSMLLGNKDIQRLLFILNPPHEETRLVGGAVRDVLLNRTVSDIDFATTLLPEKVQYLAQNAGFKTIPTGISHGTLTIIVGSSSFEVTTLREDIATDGRHAEVRFGRNFKVDALRRDFTINALSLSQNGAIHDYCDGLKHLQEKKVLFIGNPRTRIREDYLRILRFFRFSSNYSEGIDSDGLTASIHERSGLFQLTSERIRTELFKLLCSQRTLDLVRILAETGLFTLLTGGVPQCMRLERCIKHENEWKLQPDPLRRLASVSLFTQEDAQRLRDKLRLSNQETLHLTHIANIMEKMQGQRSPLTRVFIRQHFASASDKHFQKSAFVAAWASMGNSKTLSFTEKAYQQWTDFIESRENQPVFPLHGKDLLDIIPAGKDMGCVLKKAYQVWMEAGCPTGKPIHRKLRNIAQSCFKQRNKQKS